MKPPATPLPESLPLAAQLALADFDRSVNQLKQRLIGKLTRLSQLEQADFVANEAIFRKYAVLRRDTETLIDFVHTTEQAVQTLCHELGYGPLRLEHYHRLWLENQALCHRLRALQEHTQLLENVNDLLTNLLLNHYDTVQHAQH